MDPVKEALWSVIDSFFLLGIALAEHVVSASGLGLPTGRKDEADALRSGKSSMGATYT